MKLVAFLRLLSIFTLLLILFASAVNAQGNEDGEQEVISSSHEQTEVDPQAPEESPTPAENTVHAPETDIPDDPEFRPFCNATATRFRGRITVDNCANWEEQEVDMLMLFLDLLAENVPAKIATAFYNELRCLSRSNLVFDLRSASWLVCFMSDYSKTVGELLAKYVKPEIGHGKLAESVPVLPKSTRMASSFFAEILKLASSLIGDTSSIENSCCRSCFSHAYFKNLPRGACAFQPFGLHCCHTVCKSLSRMRIGMAHSVGFCCPHLYPQHCLF